MIAIRKSALAKWIGIGIIAVAATFGMLIFADSPAGTLFMEQVTNETPEAKVRAYVMAVARGERDAALDQWQLSEKQPQADAMTARRAALTGSLIASGVKPGFEVEHVERWSTCCEPRIIDNPRDAGFARMRVRLTDKTGAPITLTFDVFVPGGFWADAVGYPMRHWAIYDVYTGDQEPLLWTNG